MKIKIVQIFSNFVFNAMEYWFRFVHLKMRKFFSVVILRNYVNESREEGDFSMFWCSQT